MSDNHILGVKSLRNTQRFKFTFKDDTKQADFKHKVFIFKIYEWISALLTSFIIIFILIAFVFRIVSVSGTSMVPTLRDLDRLVVSNLNSQYKSGDIVVISQPNFTNENLIKRIVAVGGDTVDIDYNQGIVYINGKSIDEPYINSKTNYQPFDSYDFPIVIPDGYFFVMGDNRNKSLDSRSQSIGVIDERYVFGKVYFRLLPFDEWRVY